MISSFCDQIVQSLLDFSQVVEEYFKLFSFHFEFDRFDWGFVVFLQRKSYLNDWGAWFSLFITDFSSQVPVHILDVQVFTLPDFVGLNFLNLVYEWY